MALFNRDKPPSEPTALVEWMRRRFDKRDYGAVWNERLRLGLSFDQGDASDHTWFWANAYPALSALRGDIRWRNPLGEQEWHPRSPRAPPTPTRSIESSAMRSVQLTRKYGDGSSTSSSATRQRLDPTNRVRHGKLGEDMPLFKKQAQANQNDELSQLRDSIRARGQAKIPEARAAVDAYLASVAQDAAVTGDPDAETWMRDRLRMFMVIGFANWFGVLDRIPEGAALKPEWVSLTTNASQFGPEHLVAWWWHLNEHLFRGLVSNQLNEMRGALADGAADIKRRGGDYRANMVDWGNFFN